MKVTASNFWEDCEEEFFKATLGGINTCRIVSDNETAGEVLFGYVIDSMFMPIRENTPADLFHLDHKANGFFTTQEEALVYHRQLCIEYIDNLNNSTLKSCPIEYK